MAANDRVWALLPRCAVSLLPMESDDSAEAEGAAAEGAGAAGASGRRLLVRRRVEGRVPEARRLVLLAHPVRSLGQSVRLAGGGETAAEGAPLPQSVFLADRRLPTSDGGKIRLHSIVGTPDELAASASALAAPPTSRMSSMALCESLPLPISRRSPGAGSYGKRTAGVDDEEPADTDSHIEHGTRPLGSLRLRGQENALRHWENYKEIWGEVGAHLSARVGISPERLQMNRSGAERRAVVEEDALLEEARRRLAGGGRGAWEFALRESNECYVPVGVNGLFAPVRSPSLRGPARLARVRRPAGLAPLETAGVPGRGLSTSASVPVLGRPAAGVASSLGSSSPFRSPLERDSMFAEQSLRHLKLRSSSSRTLAWLPLQTSAQTRARSPSRAQSPELDRIKSQLVAMAPDVVEQMAYRSPTYYEGSTELEGSEASQLIIVNTPTRWMDGRAEFDDAIAGPLRTPALRTAGADSFSQCMLEKDDAPFVQVQTPENRLSFGSRAIDFDVGNMDEDGLRASRPHVGPNLALSVSTVMFATHTSEAQVKEVRMRNSGSVALAFEWVHMPTAGVLATPTAAAAASRFGVREVRGSLAPGEELACGVVFCSDTPGVFNDRWRLVLKPAPEASSAHPPMLELRGVCTPAADVTAAARRLEVKVAQRVVEASVREILLNEVVYPVVNLVATRTNSTLVEPSPDSNSLAHEDSLERFVVWLAWARQSFPSIGNAPARRTFLELDSLSLSVQGNPWTGDPASLEEQLMLLPPTERSESMECLYRALDAACTGGAHDVRTAALQQLAAVEARVLADQAALLLSAVDVRFGDGLREPQATCESPSGSGARMTLRGVEMAWCWEASAWVPAAELSEASARARDDRLATQAREEEEARYLGSLAGMSKRERKKVEAAHTAKEAAEQYRLACKAAEDAAVAAARQALNESNPDWVVAKARAAACHDVVEQTVRESLFRFCEAAVELDL